MKIFQKDGVKFFVFVLILALTAAVTTWLVSLHYRPAISDQKSYKEITASLSPTWADYMEQRAAYNFRDGSSLELYFPRGFSMNSDLALFDTLNLIPAVGGENVYLTILPSTVSTAMTPESYQATLGKEYSTAPETHQKDQYDAFAPDRSKPFVSGYDTSKAGGYTIYYFKAEQKDTTTRFGHIFGKYHQIDLMMSTNVKAGEYGIGAPAFTTENAEKIISTIYFSPSGMPGEPAATF